jgi:hypothetical protein
MDSGLRPNSDVPFLFALIFKKGSDIAAMVRDQSAHSALSAVKEMAVGFRFPKRRQFLF